MARLGVEEHLDPTAEISLEEVKTRAVSGVLTLTGRTFILQVVSLVATFLLTIFLTPAEYGVFFLVSAVVNFFAYFSDVGLAAALIQKKEKPRDQELKTVFTVQQMLVTGLILIILAATPLIRRWYDLADESIWLFVALAASLFLSSLKTIPSVLLERKLDFNRLVLPQIVETVLFNLVAVYLAWRGFGIASFTIAVLVRAVSGLVLVYFLQPWKPGFAFARESFSKLLQFGLPYQANTFLAVLKDDGLTVFLGTVLGPAGIGLLGWAQKWAFAPLRFFMDQVIKVTFPAFARMQDDKRALGAAVSRSISFVCFLVFPSLVGLFIVAPLLVKIIPKYGKWEPALLALGLYGVNAALAAVTTPLTNMLSSIGKIGITFRLMIMWTVLTWLLVPFLAIKAGVSGAALGSALVGASSIVAIWVAYKNVRFDLLSAVGKPLFATVVMGVVLGLLRQTLPITGMSVAVLVLLGVCIYSGVSFLLMRQLLSADARKLVHAIFAK